MEAIWQIIKNLTILNIPVRIIFFIVLVLIATLALKQLLTTIVINRIEALTRNTKTTLDDQLIAIIKQPIAWFIYLLGFRVTQLILTDYIYPQFNQTITGIINLAIVGNVTLIIYRTSPIVGGFFRILSAQTDTELDDIISPYIPKLLRLTAIVIFALKAGEVLLGTSATAIFGLIGGFGLSLGLLFKDVIVDWVGTIVIYTDALYRVNDWLLLPSGLKCTVQHIGIRSTTIYIPDKGVTQKIPNSKMIDGSIKNFSQQPIENKTAAFMSYIKIDGISSKKVVDLNDKIRAIPKNFDLLYDSCIVRFNGLERNARVIRVIGFTNDLDNYSRAYDQLNLAILALLEQEGIDLFYVNILSDTETYKTWQYSEN
ncbi:MULTISPECIES: mechanosensitive ion channel family protein [unclassified Okeania]|uniref:mechanosensitive ion channel family protein n=1 Tax=unclassified Okeania TaxID=2634635 RepID=UPI0013B5B59F|nr:MULTISPECIES: mechanosensitive ion channel family protein [unclassified Okeania]NES74622.1 mechanosensitive ion channel family protein [Okeania sp. SIO1H4]NET18696.1 mechanosensitive ion channel family protein [Okeania sp. SIO1H5]NET74794.1 mechanosensitive ion channel family protein [Okeania sp. SIO1F9]NET92343.1 mechanosensitive ion channel family protein [Okeania sp. SIO1H2]